MDASSYKKEIADHGKCINKAVTIEWAVRGASHLRTFTICFFFLINKRGSRAAFLAMREDRP